MIVALLSLVLTNNIVMSAVKWLAGWSVTRTWLRVVLALLSILGVISASALNGTPVNFDSISQWVQLIAEVAGVAMASHFSYRIIKKA